jgi:hypothetical protein
MDIGAETVTGTRCAHRSFLQHGVWQPVYGCVATLGDTTLYYYQAYYPSHDWTGPILVAGRTWKVSPGTAAAIYDTLQIQLTRAYGASRNCLDRHEELLRYHQWPASSFVVLLQELRANRTTGPRAEKDELWLQYIKEPVSCGLWELFIHGPGQLQRVDHYVPIR